MMNSHQGNQGNSSSIGTYQYQIGDQVLEIPSNINYQLENIIASGGGVQYILSDGSILVQKEIKKDSNKNNYRRMIVVNQQDLTQAAAANTTTNTTQSVPAITQQRIITQQIPTNANGTIETARSTAVNAAQNRNNATQVITPMGPLTLTPDEYNELMQRRMQKQAQVEAEAQRQAQQEAQQRAQQEAQQRAQQQQQQQLHQQQMQDHQNIAVQVQKIVQSLEEEVDGKKDDDDIEMQLIAPKMEVTDGSVHSEGTSSQDHQRRHSKHQESGEGKGAGRPFACEQCNKKFLLKHHLTTHSRVHTGERPHVCIHCGKDFAHKHCLNTHLLLHSTERPYQCTECKKCFTLKHHLLTHSRVHSRDRPFVCQECGKTFSLKRHLVTHMKFHAGERPYVCETCGESFAQEQHLVMHSRFHGSVDPFVCQDCGASFPRKFQLVNHGKLHGRLPHECTVCGQEFLQKRTLIAHMRQHTDAPHVCLECSEGFRTKSELTAHGRIVHNIQPPVRQKHASSTTTSRNQQQLEQQQQQEIEDEQEQQQQVHYLKQEQPQYETIQLQDHQNYQIMVPTASPSTVEHKTIRIQQQQPQQQNVQSQHICTQCGSCFNNREALNLHLRLHTGDKSLMTDLCALTAAIPGHIFQSGNAYIEIDGGKYNITNGTTLMANTGGSSPVPVQIITSANGQQVIEQVQSISPSLIQQQHNQHVTQQEVQIAQQQGQIVYTTVPQDSPHTQTVLVQQQQHQQTQPQQQQQPQQQVIVHHHQPHQPKPKSHFCQHCQKGFANKHGLQLHNKRHPNGECTVRSHVCNECNRAFFQKNHLLLHQRQHMEQQRGQGLVAQNDEKDAIGDGERTNGQEQEQDVEIGGVDEIENQQKVIAIGSEDETQKSQKEVNQDEANVTMNEHQSSELRTQNVIVSNNNNNNNIENDDKTVKDGSIENVQIATTNENGGSSMEQE
ncbi:hypothetical protein PVAND_001375 [Polypedilum vanderplanki]|uniref:Zinc finger protein 865 n=1 Tax=Polypedilum vanderplanki TaxID=319348 RepID=A0A9J6BP20_POLVA|nr:hypothetical protein PVAND_001375 [Polypedilum vanderplanki]